MEKVIKYKGFSLKLTITDLSKTEEPETGYHGEVKGLDGCYTDGETLEELDAHIHEVLGMYELGEIEQAINTQKKGKDKTMIKISDPEEEKTKRAEERTKQVKMVVDFLNSNFTTLLFFTCTAFIIFVIIVSAVVLQTTNTLPCQEVKSKLDKLELPQYYELRPFNPSQSTAPKLNIKNP